LKDKPLDSGTVFVGEVGLSGELRAVSHLENRLAESAKLGFTKVICPAAQLERVRVPHGLEVTGCERLAQAVAQALPIEETDR